MAYIKGLSPQPQPRIHGAAKTEAKLRAGLRGCSAARRWSPVAEVIAQGLLEAFVAAAEKPRVQPADRRRRATQPLPWPLAAWPPARQPRAARSGSPAASERVCTACSHRRAAGAGVPRLPACRTASP
eukprot:scaffold14903_cov107-Isochrysis_galbana.AAC.8